MLSFRKILCPVDMSPASRMVLSWAGLFAQVFDASVKILHADYFELPRYFVQSQLETPALQAETNRAVLHKELSQLTREPGERPGCDPYLQSPPCPPYVPAACTTRRAERGRHGGRRYRDGSTRPAECGRYPRLLSGASDGRGNGGRFPGRTVTGGDSGDGLRASRKRGSRTRLGREQERRSPWPFRRLRRKGVVIRYPPRHYGNIVADSLRKIPSMPRIESRGTPGEGLKNPGGSKRRELHFRILPVPVSATEDRGDLLGIYENERGR
jgi:hypothetical protein